MMHVNTARACPCVSLIPFPNKPLFLCVCTTILLKTLWEKEKFLVTSNFSYSHCVFHPFWRALSHINPFPNKPWFLCVCSTSLENTVEKGEIARHEQLLLFPLCFLPLWRTLWNFIIFETVVSRLFQFGRV